MHVKTPIIKITLINNVKVVALHVNDVPLQIIVYNVQMDTFSKMEHVLHAYKIVNHAKTLHLAIYANKATVIN